MCGRFYIDEDLKEDLDKMLGELNEKIRAAKNFHAGEIAPTDCAAVLVNDLEHAELMEWGYPGFGRQKIIFNARSETALQKPMFEHGFLQNRCLIPVSGFYEWDKGRQKFYFRQKDEGIMYLGAIWDRFEGGKRFTILTREADEEMEPVHHRMPVIIKKEKRFLWMDSLQEAKRMVYAKQPDIYGKPAKEMAKEEQPEYEQIHIFNTFNL